MKAAVAVARKPLIRVAVVESDPLRFVGFRALFDTEPDLELVSASLADLGQLQAIDLVLDRKSTRLNSSHLTQSRMPSSA